MTDEQATTDETQPHPASDRAATAPAPSPARADGPAPAPADRPRPNLRADPSRPADSGWREPAWFPPKDRERERRSNPVAIAIGLGMIALGVYFFIDRTLGIALPRIQWGAIWPIALIVIGGIVLLRSVNRRS